MNLIRISTDLEMTVHDFPSGSYSEQNEALRKYIGSTCETYEHVMPKRLYTVLGGSNKVTKEPGNCIGMLVDGEGILRDLDTNIVGCYLYETDKHGCPIVGNILIIGETWNVDGIDFCGISEQQFNLLYPKLEELVKKARESK